MDGKKQRKRIENGNHFTKDALNRNVVSATDATGAYTAPPANPEDAENIEALTGTPFPRQSP